MLGENDEDVLNQYKSVGNFGGDSAKKSDFIENADDTYILDSIKGKGANGVYLAKSHPFL